MPSAGSSNFGEAAPPPSRQAFLPFRLKFTALAVPASQLIVSIAFAADCTELGLVRDSAQIMQLSEAAQDERPTTTYRDRLGQAWFLPLKGEHVGHGSARRLVCTLDGINYWRLEPTDPALRHDSSQDKLTFIDMSQATLTLDGRRSQILPPAASLNSAGINYQVALNYAQSSQRINDSGPHLNASTFGNLYAYRGGWYASNSFGWSQNTKLMRYETYALHESVETGLSLRLGDSVSRPTRQGESLQFAGISWGTDRNLRPGDFAPVLPALRNGSVLPGPLEVFINDTLQFQQNLQSGVYDLRNIPAQQGFNSYSVRTLDAQGNLVTVQREIYLPSSLLPAGIQSWQIDAGFRRKDFLIANANYGAPFVAGSYARGLSDTVTLGGQALYSRAASVMSVDYGQRLSDYWTGHIGLQAAKNMQRQGQALQARLEGGGRTWRILTETTQALKPLPGLTNRASLESQRLLRAQWNGWRDWNVGLTLVRSQREQTAREGIAALLFSTRLPNTHGSVSLGLTQTTSATGKQNAVTVSLFLPLGRSADQTNRSLYASQSSIDGKQLSRVQYDSSGQDARDSAWMVGATHDTRQAASSVDATWTGTTDKFELLASGRASSNDRNALVMLRSGLLWTEGALYSARPINGAFALVSAGEKDVGIYYENRDVGKTNNNGMLLVPGLRPFESNRLTVNPATWPIHWIASDVEREVVPPRGGGVRVSFKINAETWPAQTLLTPLTPNGKPYAAGTLVNATAEGESRETVIDRRGQLWIAELLPASTFTITQSGQRCTFRIPQSGAEGSTAPNEAISMKAESCEEAR